MATNPLVSSRVDPAVVARLERCAEAMTARAEPGAPDVDRGAIVRILILRGLPGLEAELSIAPAKGKASKPAKRKAT